MATIASLKEQVITQTPLLLFETTLADGEVERWSTHAVTVDAEDYAARVLRHNFFEMQAASDSGIDAIPRISITLGNADSHFSQVEAGAGLKGARVTARFLFYDLVAQQPDSESMVVFRGVLNPPDEITETAVRLSAVNRMNMQRVLLPPVRIQRRCPWSFPATAEERQEAADGGAEGRYSRFYACGYSAGEAGGAGNLDGSGQPFTNCALTRSDCEQRGMFDQDDASNTTRRFGGIEFVPSTIRVRSHGEKGAHLSAVVANEARYNDFVPLVYGTNWVEPPVVFARNDGNLTRMEVLLAAGRIERVVKVLVNDIEVPLGVSGRDMTATGWWNLFANGGRTGAFNLNFTAPNGSPLGDPYGSMAALSVVTPNEIHDGGTLPRVKILLDGLHVETFTSGGVSSGFSYSTNPAWVLLDVLRRSGWRSTEIDLASFAAAAAVCDETIAATDNQGNPISVERFRCHLTVRSRRTAADLIRGVRNSARLQLTYRDDGKLAVFVEDSLLRQQPEKPAGSNATEQVNGGWPAYVYVDGSVSGTASGILRRDDGAASVRLWSRPIADTPNRFSVEFADELNEYQQDSLALVDAEDLNRTGQEISGRLVVDGLPTYDQAARVLKFFLDKAIHGNRFIELETTVKALGQRPGDIIAVAYAKEGLLNQPFRILKIQPGANYRVVKITAQLHDDAWYNDTNGQLTLTPPSRRSPSSELSLPNAINGSELDEFGEPTFGVEEVRIAGPDGSMLTELEVSFTGPTAGRSLRAGVPLVSLQPTVEAAGGSLEGGQTLYYAVTATDSDGLEGNASFVIRAEIPAGGATFQVRLTGLSFTSGSVSFSVYRGESPTRLARIASGVPLAATFEDTGLAADLDAAPDPQYDHANFYWRFESLDEQFASDYGPDRVGSSALAMETDAFVGRAVRLVRGKGAGQERTIVQNTAETLFVEPEWQIEPDASTIFVVSENTWRFGGRARSSPARFQAPNRQGEVIQITGRAANARNVESLERQALVSRWRIGGGQLGVADQAEPPAPFFGLNAPGDGTIALGAVGFSTLENTQGVSTGTLTLHYRDELGAASSTALAAGVDDIAETITLDAAGAAAAGDLVQVGGELMEVTETLSGGTEYTVSRGALGSTAVSHPGGETVWHLLERTDVAAFPRAFFGTEASGGFAHSVRLPHARIAGAELVMTNAFGPGEAGAAAFSELADNGLRTLYGGQFSLQMSGLLGTIDDAVPPLTVQTGFAIRDVFAVVKSPPEGSDLTLEVLREGQLVTVLTIPDGAASSNTVNGADLEPLQEGDRLTLNVTGVGSSYPGADLTVTIRV